MFIVRQQITFNSKQREWFGEDIKNWNESLHLNGSIRTIGSGILKPNIFYICEVVSKTKSTRSCQEFSVRRNN